MVLVKELTFTMQGYDLIVTPPAEFTIGQLTEADNIYRYGTCESITTLLKLHGKLLDVLTR